MEDPPRISVRLGRITPTLPRPAGIGAESVTGEEQREASLGDFESAELDPAGGLPFPGARPAVAGRRRPATGPRLEEMPDERFIGPRVLALDGDAEAASPAG